MLIGLVAVASATANSSSPVSPASLPKQSNSTEQTYNIVFCLKEFLHSLETIDAEFIPFKGINDLFRTAQKVRDLVLCVARSQGRVSHISRP
jgi:hypothetical protein